MVVLRLRRYFQPDSGQSEASKEAIEMYKDVKKRNMAATMSSVRFCCDGV